MAKHTQRHSRWQISNLALPAIVALLIADRCIAQPASKPEATKPAAKTSPDKESPKVERTAEPVPVDGPTISVSGAVVTEDGKPVAGASVVLRNSEGGTQYVMGLPHNRDVLARTYSDEQGRFAFEKIGIPPRMDDAINKLLQGQGGVEVLAWSEGLAVASSPVRQLKANDDLHLTLKSESVVTGTIKDESGKGAEGVRIHVYGITPATTNPDMFLNGPGDTNLNRSQVDLGSIADANGGFQLHNLPRDRRVFVACERHDLAREFFVLDTGAEGQPSQVKLEGGGRNVVPLRRSPINLTLMPQRFVTLKVLDHEGKPATNGGVEVIISGRNYAGRQGLSADGVTHVSVLSTGACEFRYFADPLSSQLGTRVTAEVAADAKGQPVEIQLPKPRWLEGRVVDADSGKGVTGAYVSYSSGGKLDDNGAKVHSMAVSGTDGIFRLPVFAGKGSVSFVHKVHGYLAPIYENLPDHSDSQFHLPVDIAAEGHIEPITMPLSIGMVIRGSVKDAEGQSVANAVVRGASLGRPYVDVATVSGDDGKFELRGLSPHVNTNISIANEKGAAQTAIAAERDHPSERTRFVDLNLELKSGVVLTGRVLKDGKPRAGVQMKLSGYTEEEVTPGGMKGRRRLALGTVATDAEGRYRIGGLTPGDHYSFEIIDPEGLTAPAWTHQSPYMPTTKAGAAEITLPDAILISSGQTLRGVVVDPAGKPVAGIQVSAQLRNGRHLSSLGNGRRPPWAETDEQGKFELVQLPDEPIDLMAYMRNPKGGRIFFPAKVRPEINQQDIRILYDPSLTEDVENLDEKPKDAK
jgi:protocatechuate 3,4-dioxygenase beta subunit